MASIHTRLIIRNLTAIDISKMIVNEIDDHDWDGDSRPDHNIHGKGIPAYEMIDEREEINRFATSNMVTIEFQFSNGDSFKYRFDQRKAIEGKFAVIPPPFFPSVEMGYVLHVFSSPGKEKQDGLWLDISAKSRG